MSGSCYNGYNWQQRSAMDRAINRGDAGADFRIKSRPCGLCGDPDRDPGNWHSEDYSLPYRFAPPATYPLCNACHGRIHKRFKAPAGEWKLFCRHVDAGGYGREFTTRYPLSVRKRLREAPEPVVDFIRQRPEGPAWWHALTLDPESLIAPWARPRPLRPRADPDDFRAAIAAIGLSATEEAMLRFHANAPRRTATMCAVAQAVVGSGQPAAVNLTYDRLAHRLCAYLKWEPDRRDDGSPIWMSMVAEGWQPPSASCVPRAFEWVLVPTLAILFLNSEGQAQ